MISLNFFKTCTCFPRKLCRSSIWTLCRPMDFIITLWPSKLSCHVVFIHKPLVFPFFIPLHYSPPTSKTWEVVYGPWCSESAWYHFFRVSDPDQLHVKLNQQSTTTAWYLHIFQVHDMQIALQLYTFSFLNTLIVNLYWEVHVYSGI